jgi:hypothetical protein
MLPPAGPSAAAASAYATTLRRAQNTPTALVDLAAADPTTGQHSQKPLDTVDSVQQVSIVGGAATGPGIVCSKGAAFLQHWLDGLGNMNTFG